MQPVSWRKSSECANGECLEISGTDSVVRLRSSLSPQHVLEVTRSEWATFARAVRRGEFDDVVPDGVPG
jgi:uncharacterized protein DUF397